MAKSGFEQLLEELKKAGMEMNGQGGSSSQQGNPYRVDAQNVSTSDVNESSGASGTGAAGTGASGAGAGGPKTTSAKATAGGRKSGGGKGFGGFGGFGGGRGGRGGNGNANVETPLGERVGNWGRKALTTAIIVLIVVILCAYWWFHPAINLHSSDTWMFLAIFVLLPCWFVLKNKSKKFATGTEKIEKSESKAKLCDKLSWVPVVVIIIGLIGALLSLSFIPGNAKKYASILETQTMDFATDIMPVDYSEIPVIDRETAIVLGNRVLGEIPDYVSQFEVDTLYSQINYQGTPVRVSPLNYADLFKWLMNRSEGIPAYAVVDMTTQNAKIIRISDVDGTAGEGIKYCQSEPLGRNIDRYVQLSYPFYMFDELSFEVDEKGHPWWICPVQKRTIGLFGGTTIQRVVLVDAVTGDTQDLELSEVPQWVDRVFPAELLIQQYNWYGSLNNGWFNSWLGQSGVVQTTPGDGGDLGYNYIAKDDDVWVYTGVTSATSDNSIIGFVLVNQRTQESHFYSVAGATEESAMSSAEGQVQNLRYTATFPILINVANQPTYFMALKDSAGLVKKFAMIDIQRYQNVAVGDTVAATQHAYLQLLSTYGIDTSVVAGEADESKADKGTIKNMLSAVSDGVTHVYVTISGYDRIYDFVLPSMVEIVKYSVGDTISVSAIENNSVWVVNRIY